MTAANYTAQGQVLSNIGTVIGLENGPLTDQFFLQFDQLGTATNVIVEQAPTPTPTPLGPVLADVGVRTFAQVELDAVATDGCTDHECRSHCDLQGPQGVQQQLPPIPTLEAFSSANQVGVAQLAIQICSTMMNTPALQSKMFGPGVSFNGSQFSTPAGISAVTGPLAAAAVGNGLLTTSQRRACAVSNGSIILSASLPWHAPVPGQRGARVGGGQRGLRRGVRQCRSVDQLSSRRIEEALLPCARNRKLWVCTNRSAIRIIRDRRRAGNSLRRAS